MVQNAKDAVAEAGGQLMGSDVAYADYDDVHYDASEVYVPAAIAESLYAVDAKVTHEA